jgi:hypothetical protein
VHGIRRKIDYLLSVIKHTDAKGGHDGAR